MYALNLTRFPVFFVRSTVERDCDPMKLHQWRIGTDQIPVPILRTLMERDLFVIHGEGFHTPANALLPIHVDGPELTQRAKLNWSWGSPGSKMMFWKLKSGKSATEMTTGIGTRYLTMNAADCVPVHSCEIGSLKPTLVNVGQPHSVMNMKPNRRWVLSLVLGERKSGEPIDIETAAERLKDLV